MNEMLWRNLFLLCCIFFTESVGGQEDTNNATNVTNNSPSSLPGTVTAPDLSFVPSESANHCSQLEPGDVFVFVVETNGPVGTIVGFLALVDLPPGLELQLTDRPWNGTTFLPPTGTVLQLTVPDEGITALQRFGYGNFSFDEKWRDVITDTLSINTLDLNHTEGDSLFLYCVLPSGEVRHLVGFSNAGEWAPPGLDSNNESFSALPSDLTNVGSILLPHKDNYEYVGPNIGRKVQLQSWMMNASMWNGTDESFFDVDVITVVLENTTTVTWSVNPNAQPPAVTPPPNNNNVPESAPTGTSTEETGTPTSAAPGSVRPINWNGLVHVLGLLLVFLKQ